MWIFIAIGVAVVALAHTAPAPFLLDALAGKTSVWRMPKSDPPAMYLTYDDGPNPATTPLLLDLLAREGVRATFFLIDRNVTEQTAPLVARMFADGHSVALHSHTRAHMVMPAEDFARTLTTAAERIERLTGRRPCRAYRPHAGWRSESMYVGLKKIDHRLVGWSWMKWDWNWFRRRTGSSVASRVLKRASAGDIVVMHDGNHAKPNADHRYAVEATALLIPGLRARGFVFASVCDTAGAVIG